MKNLKGCISDSEKRRFHTLGLHKPIAALNAIIKTGYNVVDGICGDLSFEEGGTPVESNRIIAGRDPLMLDSYCAELIGYKPDEIGYLAHGKKLGVGRYYTSKTQIIELNTQNKPRYVKMKAGRDYAVAESYKNLINENCACSACYSALIYALHRSVSFYKSGNNPKDKIYIGQGFKGRGGAGLGIGKCADKFDRHVPGCPPKASDIYAKILKNKS